MGFSENRIFRVTLLIVTLIVFYLWLQNFSKDEETSAPAREDASEEEVLSTSRLTQSVTPGPVVRTAPEGSLVPEAETAQDTASVLEVQVRPGDTLEGIANSYQTTVAKIQADNPGKSNANLMAGETLRIVGASTDATALENPSADREAGQSIIYMVEPGDFLSSIAQKYEVSEQALIDANPAIDANNLQVGQQLTIPPKGTGLAATIVERPPGESTPYVIEVGDSLGLLAENYGVTVEEILDVNPALGGNASGIIVGQQIIIPPTS